MTQKKNKYSLWLVPRGEAGNTLQSLVNRLAKQYNAPLFIPHLTIVANIFADNTEIEEIKRKVANLTRSMTGFTYTLADFGFKDEEFRCLYLLAKSPQLDGVYAQLSSLFPQVHNEPFRALPHISILYGNYSSETKKQIIRDNQLAAVECVADSFELYLTNDPISSWKQEDVFLLS